MIANDVSQQQIQGVIYLLLCYIFDMQVSSSLQVFLEANIVGLDLLENVIFRSSDNLTNITFFVSHRLIMMYIMDIFSRER